MPQIGCDCPNCHAARTTGHRRFAASLALVVEQPGERSVVLIDAGPDLRRQTDLIPPCPAEVRPSGRAPFQAVLLTHLHMGHYAGLLELGPEVLDARGMPVFCTYGVADVLCANAPWSLLVARGNIDLRPIAPGSPFEPVPGLRAEAFRVPHRDEFGDTVGFAVGAPGGRPLIYIPDADNWHGMAPPLRTLVQTSEVALLDGTFFDRSELTAITGRDQGEVPHPPVSGTVGELDGLLDRVVFTHLNHSNPLTAAGSPQSRWLAERGARVAIEGMRLALEPQSR